MDEPTYGGQLQDRSIHSVPVEGRMVIVYRVITGQYPDGTEYTLREPAYDIGELAFGPLREDVRISPRVAPAVVGMGLLEAIPEERILSLADADDADGDGISGRPNYILDVRSGEQALGRFGWKANQPTVEQQSAGAFLGDIGVTSSLFPEENCPAVQVACANAVSGGSPEIPDERLAKVTIYVQTLAAPAMRDAEDATVEQGRAHCSSRTSARRATPLATRRATRTRWSRFATRSSSRTPTCCCTTWGPALPTTDRTAWRAAPSGAPRRCGALGLWTR